MNNADTISDTTSRLQRVYDVYRTCKLNEIYYFTMFRRAEKQTLIFDIMIALATSAFPLLVFLTYKSLIAYEITIILASCIAILGITRPLLGLSRKQYQYSTLYRGYVQIRIEMEALLEDIQLSHQFGDRDLLLFQKLRKEMSELASQGADTAPSPALIRRLQAVVEAETPVEAFRRPSDDSSGLVGAQVPQGRS